MKYIVSLLLTAASFWSYGQCNISSVTATANSSCAGENSGSIVLSNLPVTSGGGVGTIYDCNGTLPGTVVTQLSGNLVISSGQTAVINSTASYTSISIDGGTLIAHASVTTGTLTITNKGSIYACGSLTVNTSSNIGSGSRAVVGNGSISLLGNTVSQGLLYNIYGTYTVRYGSDISTIYIPVGSLMGSNGAVTAYDANNIPDWGNTVACTISWSGTSQTGASISGLAPGNYTATINCGSGCSGTKTVTVGTKAAPAITYTKQDAVNGQNGSITTSVTGGTGSYAYLWSSTTDVNFSATTANVTGLTPGTYKVQVTDNSSGCKTTSALITIANTAVCDYSNLSAAVTGSCTGLNQGSITLSGLGFNGGAAYGPYYKCTDGRDLGTVSGNLTVSTGDVVRITSGNIGTLTINGGTVLICGSAAIQNMVLSNGASFNVVSGSAVVYQPFDIPAGCTVATHEGALALYSQGSGNTFQDMNVYGSLLLVNGAMHATAIKLNIYGKLVNYTEIDCQYLSVKSGGVFDNYGQWIEATNNPYQPHEILAGGIMNLYSTFGVQVHQLILNGTVNAKPSANTCLQVLDNLSGTGRVQVESGGALSLCYNKTLPSTLVLGPGITQNTGTCACTFTSRTINNNNVAAIYGSGSSSGCSVTWTGTSQTGSAITGLAPGTYTATITCGSCTTTRTYTVAQKAAPVVTVNPETAQI